MTFSKLFLASFSVVLVSGCAENHPAPVYRVAPEPWPPTSTRPDVRVYAPPPAAAPGPVAEQQDVALAQSIRDLFKGDPTVAGITGNVEVKVHHGFVTWRGSVPTENDRQLIKSRVSNLPGMAQIN